MYTVTFSDFTQVLLFMGRHKLAHIIKINDKTLVLAGMQLSNNLA